VQRVIFSFFLSVFETGWRVETKDYTLKVKSDACNIVEDVNSTATKKLKDKPDELSPNHNEVLIAYWTKADMTAIIAPQRS
jgi:hypothetical protein